MGKKISIIVPVYNTETFISRCLDSLIKQTYSNIEIICINDGSTDASLRILNNYKNTDERINVTSQENSGAGSARNKGLDIASGDYIMFCDSDDYYCLNMCELMLNAIESKDVDLVTCDFNVSDNNGYVRDEENASRPKLFGYHKLSPQKRIKLNPNVWNKIFKREIIKNYQLQFSDKVKIAEDWCFFVPYACVAKSLYGLDMTLYQYQTHENSLMSNAYSTKEKLLDKVIAERIITEKLKQIDIFNTNFEYWLKLCFAGLYWLCNIPTFSQEQKVNLLNLYNREIFDDVDLDIDVSDEYEKELDFLKAIKNREYDLFLEFAIQKNNESNQKKKKKEKISSLLLSLAKSYIFFPYYIYSIYKVVKKINKDNV